MARRLLRLIAIAAVTAQQQTQTTTTFQQGAKKEWTFGDNQYKKVRDAVKPRTGGGMEDERWKLDDRSECYSGTDEYMLRSVFCDAECLSDNKNDPNCAGPWYCARTKVCEEFHDPDNRDNVDPCVEINVAARLRNRWIMTSTPSTRCLLDGVVMPVPHRSTEPARDTG